MECFKTSKNVQQLLLFILFLNNGVNFHCAIVKNIFDERKKKSSLRLTIKRKSVVTRISFGIFQKSKKKLKFSRE